MTICGQVLYAGTSPAAICTHPWGVEHDHDVEPFVHVYDGENEPDRITVREALRRLVAGSIYQHEDGTFWAVVA